MKKIILNKEKCVLVDNKYFDLVSKYRWYIHNGYALTDNMVDGKRTRTRMHRMIFGNKVGKYTDHKNGNKLDNRLQNLRICTNAQNMRNIPAKKQNTSGFKGVTWQKDCLRWKAQIKFNYKNIHIGVFKLKTDAALAYNQAAKKYFGKFAWLNPI